MYKHGLKRVIDFILVFIVLVVIWPILLLITIW
ncbi:UNVERIFIED_CONTAM: sugar transferase, partial [Prevotella sp. 15_C9]